MLINTKLKNSANFKWVLGVITTICTFLFGLYLPVTANAQGINLEVSPAKVNIVLEAGTTVTQKFRVGNFSNAKKNLYLYTEDFVVLDDAGTPSFLETKDPDNERFSLTNWIELDSDTIELESNEVKEVEVKIKIPEDATPGGHYAAFFVQSEKPDPTGNSSIGSIGRVASLILGTVPGDVDENISVVKFFANKGVYFNDNPRVEITAQLANSGTVHAIPTGAAFLSGAYSYKPKSLLFNQRQGAILPNAPDRTITESLVIEKKGFVPPIGKMDVNLLMKYGSNNNELNAYTSFWLLPIKFIIVVLLGLVALLFVLWRTILSFKK